MCTKYKNVHQKNKKAFFKMDGHMGIKTKKAQKQDWDGTLATKLN